jgi:predicted nucleic acid-binding protein
VVPVLDRALIDVRVFRPLLAVQSSVALYGEALRVHQSNKLSWFDSLIVSAAIQAGCDRLYTQDLQNGLKIETLPVVNPFL